MLFLLLGLLPFHMVIKRVLPDPLGSYWKEGLLVLLVLGVAVRSAMERRLPLPRAWLNLPILAFLAILVLRFATGGDPFLDAWGLYKLGAYMLLYFVVINVVKSPTQLIGYGAVILLAGVVSSIGAISESVADAHFFPSTDIKQYYGQWDIYVYATHVRRVYFTFDSPMALGSYLAILIPLAGVAFMITKSKLAKSIFAASVLLMTLGLVLTFSRGPLMALLAALGSLGVLASGMGRSLKPLLISLAAIGGVLVLAIAVGAVVSERSGEKENVAITQLASGTQWQEEPTNVVRAQGWKTSLEYWARNPWWGLGLGRTGEVSVRFMPLGQGFITESQPLKVAVEAGGIGLAFYLAVWAVAFLVGIREGLRSFEWEQRAQVLGILASLAGIFVHGLIHQNLEVKQTDMLFWLLLGALSLRQIWGRTGVLETGAATPPHQH